MDDSFVPHCKEDGSYADIQCFEHEGFGKQCWCADKDGQEIKGTRTSDGTQPSCGQNGTNNQIQSDKPSPVPSQDVANVSLIGRSHEDICSENAFRRIRWDASFKQPWRSGHIINT